MRLGPPLAPFCRVFSPKWLHWGPAGLQRGPALPSRGEVPEPAPSAPARGSCSPGGGEFMGSGLWGSSAQSYSLLQGFTPKLLHLRLWRQQWDGCGAKRGRLMLRRGRISREFSCRSRSNPPIPSALCSLEGPWSCQPPAASHSHEPHRAPLGTPLSLCVTVQPPALGSQSPFPAPSAAQLALMGLHHPAPLFPAAGWGGKPQKREFSPRYANPRLAPTVGGSGTRRPLPPRSR